MNDYNKEEAIIGCLLGTAVGDALGLSYEGLSQKRVRTLYRNIEQYHFLFGKGMVSDDTEHSCMVAQSLIAANGDIQAFKRVFAWKLRFWILGLPAGIGFATLRAILKLWLGCSADKSGVFSAGNGPAMRSAIIGVCYGQDRDKLMAFTHASTYITHTDSKAFFGALAVAWAAYLSSLKQPVSPENYLNQLKNLLKDREAIAFIQLIEKAVSSVTRGESVEVFAHSLGLNQHGISGYVYHTVPVVIHAWLSHQGEYKTAIIELIQCGGDTDTTAAILGGIIGAGVGKKGIPHQWIEDLWEFPRTIHWMERLGKRLNLMCSYTIRQDMLSIPLFFVFIRNIAFMFIVLFHGFRRLFPPY